MTMKAFMATMALLSALSVAACNTAEGIGKDMQDAGKAIEDHADP